MNLYLIHTEGLTHHFVYVTSAKSVEEAEGKITPSLCEHEKIVNTYQIDERTDLVLAIPKEK